MANWFRKKPPVFSEEAGITPLPVMKLGEITTTVRRDIIDCLNQPPPYMPEATPYLMLVVSEQRRYGTADLRTREIVESWLDVIGVTLKTYRTSSGTREAVLQFLDIINKGAYHEVLDIIGRVVNEFDAPLSGDDRFLNDLKRDPSCIIYESGHYLRYHNTVYLKDMVDIFNNNGAAYRLNVESYPYRFAPVVSDLQAELLTDSYRSLRDEQMGGSLVHLNKANEFFIEKRYADSVKESVHAVESVVQSRHRSSTFSKALDKMRQDGRLNHPALQTALKRLYGWASNEEGVRHSLITQSEDSITEQDALLIHGLCASLAAYLANS